MIFSLDSGKIWAFSTMLLYFVVSITAGLAIILGGVVGSICCSPEADRVLARLLRVPKQGKIRSCKFTKNLAIIVTRRKQDSGFSVSY